MITSKTCSAITDVLLTSVKYSEMKGDIQDWLRSKYVQGMFPRSIYNGLKEESLSSSFLL